MTACSDCQNPDFCRRLNYCGFDPLIVTREEFYTVVRAMRLFEDSMGSMSFRLCMRPHRKAHIVQHLLMDHQDMTVERAEAIAAEMVA